MRNAIVTCVTADWIRWAAVTLLSCVENGKCSGTDLLICAHGASRRDYRELRAFNRQYGLNIRLVEVDASKLTTAPLGKWGIGTVIRLMLDRVLDPHYGRVLYLDSDLLVQAPLDGILNADLGAHIAAAVPDMGFFDFLRPRATAIKRALGFNERSGYFNAGVILFDWQKTLEFGVLRRTLDELNSRKDLGSPDQDALNIVLKNRWQKLSYRWNVLDVGRLYLDLDGEASIVHFTGRKPWTPERRRKDEKYHRYYIDRLAPTPWAGSVARRRSLAGAGEEVKSFWKQLTRFRRRQMLRDYLAHAA